MTTGFGALTNTLTNGTTGAAKACFHFHTQQVLASSATYSPNFKLVTDVFGNTQAFTLIMWLLLRITVPTLANYLTIAPGASTGMTSIFTGTSPKLLVYDTLLLINQIDGYAVGSTTKILDITNAGALSLTFDLVAVGQ